MSGATHALVIDTRPVWEPPIQTNGFSEFALPYVAAPLQSLRRLPQSPLLNQWAALHLAKSEHGAGLAIVATSPASVEALQGMPGLSKEMAASLVHEPMPLFAVGAASARCLAAWASNHGLAAAVNAPERDSGVQAFIKFLGEISGPYPRFVLLESSSNRPDLALSLREKGFRAERLGLYERMDCPLASHLMKVDIPRASRVYALVSSSSLVGLAASELRQVGLDPLEVRWLCHHNKILRLLEAAGFPHRYRIDNLDPVTILAKVIELSRMND
jgi:uroporphyrinogen-III synthase